MGANDIEFWRGLKRELELKRASQGPFDSHDLAVCDNLVEFCTGQITRLVTDKLIGEDNEKSGSGASSSGPWRAGSAGYKSGR